MSPVPPAPDNALEVCERLSKLTGVTVLPNEPLAPHTRFAIGGPADIFFETASPESFAEALKTVREAGLNSVVIGGGSNLIVADEGFRGVCLKLSSRRLRAFGLRVEVECGVGLQALVNFTAQRGLKGLETLTGIPGSVGGAVYGNAGAYGHSIQERILSVHFLDGEKGDEVREFSRAECEFRYRDSIFKKKKDWIILSATLDMETGNAVTLRETSARILSTRTRKYPPSMRCAGSIFKNLILAELPRPVAASLPPGVVIEGKVPSAWFLEQIGAKGMKRGDLEVADYHANLIFNNGEGTAKDLVFLIRDLKRRVAMRFGIDLEEEVQYVGFDAEASQLQK